MRVPNPYCHRGNSSPAKTFLITLDLEQKRTGTLKSSNYLSFLTSMQTRRRFSSTPMKLSSPSDQMFNSSNQF